MSAMVASTHSTPALNDAAPVADDGNIAAASAYPSSPQRVPTMLNSPAKKSVPGTPYAGSGRRNDKIEMMHTWVKTAPATHAPRFSTRWSLIEVMSRAV